jgi:oligosaccharide repeat unit polymerase
MRRGSKHIFIIVLFILVGVTIGSLVNAINTELYSIIISFSILTVLFALIVPNKDVMNPLTSFVLGAYIIYGLNGLFFFFYPENLTSYFFRNNIPYAMVIIAVAIISLALGYKSRFHKIISSRLSCIKLLREDWKPQRVAKFFLVYYVLIWTYRLISIWKGAYFSVGDVDNLPTTSLFFNIMGFFFSDRSTGNVLFLIAMLFVLILMMRNNGESAYKRYVVVLVLVSIIELVISFIGGSRAFLLQTFIAYILISNYLLRRIGLKRIALFSLPVVIFVFLIYTYGSFYRGITKAYFNMPSVINNLKNAYDLFNVNVLEGTEEQKDFFRYSFLKRIDAMNSLTASVDYIERTGNYWLGESFILPLQALVPRAIWSSKQIFAEYIVDNVFGRKVGILPPFQYDVWISVALPTEYYINFGIAGVIIFMFIVGILYRVGYEVLMSNEKAPGNILFYFIFWYFSVFLGFYFVTGVVILQIMFKLIFLYIALQVVTVRKRARYLSEFMFQKTIGHGEFAHHERRI